MTTSGDARKAKLGKTEYALQRNYSARVVNVNILFTKSVQLLHKTLNDRWTKIIARFWKLVPNVE
jgi:hypothetical protein